MKGIALLLSFLVLSGFILESRAKIEQHNKNNKLNKDPQKLSSRIEKIIKKTCTANPFNPLNRPPSIRFDSHEGIALPESCARLARTGEDAYKLSCEQEQPQWDAFFNQTDSMPQVLQDKRDNINNEIKLNKAVELFYKKNVRFTAAEYNYFNNILRTLDNIEAAKIISEYAQELKIGNCGEHANHNLYKLLKADTQHELKLQIVQLFVPDDSHSFLIINSDAPDIFIRDNQEATTNYLCGLNEGFICDTWNNGFFDATDNNANEYYKLGWRSIKVETISPNFDADLLPNEASKFVNRQLKRMDLPEVSLKRKPATEASHVRNQDLML